MESNGRTCPSCQQPFLTGQQQADTTVQCPHCAHTAPLREFPPLPGATGSAASLPLQRRQPRAPSTEPIPQETPQSSPGTPPPSAPPLVPTRPSPRTPHQPTSIEWSAPPTAEELEQHPAGSPNPPIRNAGRRRFGVLLGLLVCLVGAIGLVWRDWTEKTQNENLDAADPEEVILRPVALDEPQQGEMEIEQELAIHQLSSIAPNHLEALFKGPDEVRAQHVFEPQRWRSEMAGFFSRHPDLNVVQLKRAGVFPKRLVSGEAVPLFHLITNRNPTGALAVFHSTADGNEARLDWPLFHDTHEQRLSRYLDRASRESVEAEWFHVGLRRSHGLELPADLRTLYHSYDLQASGSGEGRSLCHAEKELPVGRRLDQLTQWGSVYLATILLRVDRLEGGERLLTVIDFKGSGLATD